VSVVSRRPWGAGCTAPVGGLALATGAGFAVWRIAGWGGPRVMDAVQDLGLLGFASFATVCAGLAARKARGRQRRAWVFLTVGAGGWMIALVMSIYDEVGSGIDEAPFPWVFGYLLPIAGCVALVSFPVGYEGQSQARLVLDALIVEGSVFIVAWAVVLDRVYAETRANHVTLSLSLALAVAATATFTAAVLVLARARTRQRLTLRLLTAGLALMAVSDAASVGLIAHRAYARADLLAVGWAVAMLLVGLAALSSLRTSPPTHAAAPGAGANVVALCADDRGRRNHHPRLPAQPANRSCSRHRSAGGDGGFGAPIPGRRRQSAAAGHCGRSGIA
jgi:diguanylate cyclase